MGRTTTGLTTTSVIRRYHVDGDVMRYRTDMATDDTPMALHLEAELHRVDRVSDEARAARDLTYLWLAASIVGLIGRRRPVAVRLPRRGGHGVGRDHRDRAGAARVDDDPAG